MTQMPIAFCMFLKPGCEDEYERRHAQIWPDLVVLLKDAGMSDYSIFLDRQTLTLFAVLRQAPDHRRDAVALDPLMRRWWDYMADLMVVQPGNRPVERPLRLMFHMA